MTTLQPHESPSYASNGGSVVTGHQPRSHHSSPIFPPNGQPVQDKEERDGVTSNGFAGPTLSKSSPGDGRKRTHPPDELDIDSAPAPNKRLHTPTVSWCLSFCGVCTCTTEGLSVACNVLKTPTVRTANCKCLTVIVIC